MSQNKSIVNFHGSIVNAGDFLIQDSARLVLEHIFPNVSIMEASRHYTLPQHLEAIGFYFGGPFLRKDLFPSVIPNQPILTLPVGVGVLNEEASQFTSETERYFFEVRKYFPTGRDLRATKVLQELGCTNAKLGGCPAFLAGLLKQRIETKNVSKIVVSDPSWGINYLHAFELIRILRRIFKSAEITFVFHRTIFNTNYKSLKASVAALALALGLQAIGVKVCDISGSSSGFSIYDGALHVGFRVHAHVYVRSIGGASILLTEDLRSLGMNELFGDPIIEPKTITLENIRAAVTRELDSNNNFFGLQQELFEVTTDSLLKNYELA
jgi:hypothetical protein